MKNQAPRPAGRPKKWENADELWEAVVAYFEHIQGETMTIQQVSGGEVISYDSPTKPSLIDLAVHLGMSYASLKDRLQNEPDAELLAIYTYARDRIMVMIDRGAAAGIWEKSICAMNLARMNGGTYETRQEVELVRPEHQLTEEQLSEMIAKEMRQLNQ